MKKNNRTAILSLLALFAMATLAIGAEKVLFEQDFEAPDVAKQITTKKTVLEAPGPESKHCISQTVISKYNNMGVKIGAKIEEGTVLSFDYRTEVRAGKVGYMGIYLYTPEGKKMLSTVKPSPGWKHAEVAIAAFNIDPGTKVKEKLQPGETISEIQFYGRGDDNTADQTVYVDNVRLFVK